MDLASAWLTQHFFKWTLLHIRDKSSQQIPSVMLCSAALHAAAQRSASHLCHRPEQPWAVGDGPVGPDERLAWFDPREELVDGVADVLRVERHGPVDVRRGVAQLLRCAPAVGEEHRGGSEPEDAVALHVHHEAQIFLRDGGDGRQAGVMVHVTRRTTLFQP